MNSAILFTLLFLGSAGYGAYRGQMGLRTMRSRRRYQGVLFEWTDGLPSGPLHEGLAWIAPATHFVAITLIALATLLTIPQRASIPDLPPPSFAPPGLSYGLIVGLSIILVAYLWGVALSVNPFYNPIPGAGHFAVSTDGVLYGGRLYPWSSFTHFSRGEPGEDVRLWSASSPGLLVFALHPLSSNDHLTLQDTLSRFLPNTPSFRRARTWPRWMLPALMAATAAVAVFVSLQLLLSPGLFALPATAVVAFLFVVLGGRMILQFAYGGMALPAQTQKDVVA